MSDQPSGTYRPVDVSGFDPVDIVELDQPELRWLPIADLLFDTRFQRAIEKTGRANIAKIARQFDWGRFTPLLVSPIDYRRFSVIDGQHRTHAAALCGIYAVPAMVVPMSLQDQAKAFSWVNGNVTNVNGFHIFRAALVASEPWALKSQKAVADAGCELMTSNYSSGQKKPGQVFCIALVRKYVEAGNAKTITKALTALRASNDADLIQMYSAEVLQAWFATVGAFSTMGVDDFVAFIEANPFSSILHCVAKLRETPEYFRSSTRALVEASMLALFKSFVRQRAGGVTNV